MRRLANNAAIDHLRTRRKGAELPELPTPTPRERDGTDEVAGWLPALLLAVDEPYRTAVRRVDLDGISQAELARELGLSLSGARTRVQRGRERLREVLLDCCPVRFDEGEVVDTGSASRCAGGGC